MFRHTAYDKGLWRGWIKNVQFKWPFRSFTYKYEYLDKDGNWKDILGLWKGERDPMEEVHPYTYTLRDGTVQNRRATVSQCRHILARHILHRLGWPKRIKNSIEVKFDAEVGERSGSWKGGTISCDYDLNLGETMLQALRRMERERSF